MSLIFISPPGPPPSTQIDLAINGPRVLTGTDTEYSEYSVLDVDASPVWCVNVSDDEIRLSTRAWGSLELVGPPQTVVVVPPDDDVIASFW